MKEEILYEVEEFSASDYSGLIRLTESTYPGREISMAEYLKWEYQDNPDGRALIFAAMSGDKYVSQYLVIPHQFIANGVLLRGSVSVNTLTHPMHRGHALFPRLAELTYAACTEQKIGFTLGVPNASSYPIFREKLHFQTLGRVPFLMKSFRPQSVLWNLFTKKRLKKGAELSLRLDLKEKNPEEGVSFFNPNQDKNLYEVFLKKFHEEKKVATHRTLDFMRWRYFDIPLRKYHLLKLCRGGKLVALAVLRAREIYGLNALVLMDFISLADAPYPAELFESIFEISQNNDIQIIISAMQSSSQEFKHLKKAGFYKVPERFLPQQLDLILRLHQEGPEIEELKDFKSWFFTFGDYDIF